MGWWQERSSRGVGLGGTLFLLEASLRLLFQEVQMKMKQTLLILSWRARAPFLRSHSMGGKFQPYVHLETKHRTGACCESCPDWDEALRAPSSCKLGTPGLCHLADCRAKSSSSFFPGGTSQALLVPCSEGHQTPQSTLGPTVPSLMHVVPHWHLPTQTYQKTFPATENSLNRSWLNSSCSMGFEKCSNVARGDHGCYI